MRALWTALGLFLALAAGCGGEPRAEPTWETHTTAPDDGEDEPGDDTPGDEAAEDPAEP